MPKSMNGTTFVYDYSGQRVKKNSTVYIGKLYECTSGTCTKYIFAGDTRIALKTATKTLYYHPDHLGSAMAVTDASGTPRENNAYYPFGGSLSESGTEPVKHKYTSQEFDAETGLYNYNARLYAPELGRFITPDTIVQDYANPQGLSRYSYVLNNPINAKDPSGMEHMCINCQISYSAVGPNQARGIGALGISPPNDSLAISPAIFGLPYNTIAERIDSQNEIRNNIPNIFISAPGLSQYLTGGTTFTIGDIGDLNIRNSLSPRFDIYRFETQQDAIQFGKHSVPTTITGLPDSWSCPCTCIDSATQANRDFDIRSSYIPSGDDSSLSYYDFKSIMLPISQPSNNTQSQVDWLVIPDNWTPSSWNWDDSW